MPIREGESTDNALGGQFSGLLTFRAHLEPLR